MYIKFRAILIGIKIPKNFRIKVNHVKSEKSEWENYVGVDRVVSIYFLQSAQQFAQEVTGWMIRFGKKLLIRSLACNLQRLLY